MKKIYILATICLIASFVFFGNLNVVSAPAPIFHEKSILDNHPSKVELSEVENIVEPALKNNEAIDLSAQSYLIIDRDTFTPILQKNSSAKLPIASITKLMTAVVALENGKLDDMVEIKKTYSNTPTPQMGLFLTEKISLENILNGLLIASDNDAGEVIAEYIGKGDYKAFVQKMNDKAAEIGMANTHFSNAIGLDNAENYSTAWDLAYLAKEALKNSLITDLVGTKERRVKSSDGKITHLLQATNELLDDKDIQVLGIKTGLTPEAGGCLISLAKTKNGKEIISIVLGSGDRFGDTKKLIQWTERNIEWR